MRSMLNTSGKVIMVSGANRGLGNAIAKQLLADGYTVSAGARDIEALKSALGDEAGERLMCNRYDAFDNDSATAWVEATVERFGRIDGMVNNAGIIDLEPFDDITEESLDQMWAVNVKAPLRLTQLALPHLRVAGEGRVVNVASLSGIRLKGSFAPGYAMTKHAVIALTEATKQAGWEDGIRVTALCPGFVATDMTSDFGEDTSTMIDPADIAVLVSTTISLPNTAQVAALTVSCRLEPHV